MKNFISDVRNLFIGLILFVLLPTKIIAQQQYTIENCVNEFSKEKATPTNAGYQYWFADQKFMGDGRTVKLSVVDIGKANHPPHRHVEDEFILILEGKAEFYLDGKTKNVGPYTSLYCPSNAEHGVRNVGDIQLKYLVMKKYDVK